MILHVDGNINRYYAQTLCMVFFPGATFGKNEVPGEGVPEVCISVYPDTGDSVTAYASIKLNDKLSEASATVSHDEVLTIATHESIAVGRALFSAGKELMNRIPPWGILTGVRPAKVASTLLYGGNGIIRSKRILRDEYFLNPQKAALAVSVASTEMKVLKRMEKRSCSIYISIPFCPSRCAYCSFVSYTTPRLLSLIDRYVEAVITDLLDTFDTIRKLGLHVSTVYIGGGTPTTLNPQQLERLLSVIDTHVDVTALQEFTLEAGRPDTITAEKLAIAKSHGVTRISVNPQTLSDDILRDIGRHHTVEDFFRAYELARESGIRDINVDLIAGLPGDDFRNFSDTVDRIIDLGPTNVTIHTFCVKKAADVLRKNAGIYSLPADDAAKSVSYSQIKLKFAGYKPYYMYRQKNTVGNLENVGFAKEGHEGLYNIYMMEETQSIFAIGAGAVTKLVRPGRIPGSADRIVRLFNPKYPYEYLRQHDPAQSAEDAVGKPTRQEEILSFYADADA